jgi:hypothetical protein
MEPTVNLDQSLPHRGDFLIRATEHMGQYEHRRSRNLMAYERPGIRISVVKQPGDHDAGGRWALGLADLGLGPVPLRRCDDSSQHRLQVAFLMREVGVYDVTERVERGPGLVDIRLSGVRREGRHRVPGQLHGLSEPFVLAAEITDQGLISAELPQRWPEDRFLSMVVVIELVIEVLPGHLQLRRSLS